MDKEKALVKSEKDIIKVPTMIAAVRVRGLTGVKHDIKDTMSYLNLHRKNYCVILEKKPNVIGMLKKAKDFLTWGEVSKEVIELLKKRDEGKKFFRLNSPRKGFGRKGIKTPFGIGGALGYRGENIDDLIKRMV
jgi:large subunit ribosomal protein L30